MPHPTTIHNYLRVTHWEAVDHEDACPIGASDKIVGLLDPWPTLATYILRCGWSIVESSRSKRSSRDVGVDWIPDRGHTR